MQARTSSLGPKMMFKVKRAMSPGPRALKRAAFTLVELLLVLVLLGVFSTSAAVAFQGRDRPYALRVMGEDLGAAFRSAGSASRATRRPHRVVLDEVERVFWIEGSDAEAEGGFARVRGMAGRPHAFIDGVMVSSTGDAPKTLEGWAVFSFGLAPGPPVACELTTIDGDRLWVRAAGRTGQVVLDEMSVTEDAP